MDMKKIVTEKKRLLSNVNFLTHSVEVQVLGNQNENAVKMLLVRDFRFVF